MTTALVNLWGTTIGAVSLDRSGGVAEFEYDDAFLGSPIEVAPLMMPIGRGAHRFPALNRDVFKGLPGLLADSLPDSFGNAVIDSWLATQGRTPESMDAVERLCYIGRRGMGALEFDPTRGPSPNDDELQVARLVELADAILAERDGLSTTLDERGDGLTDILSVGTSAGGARAKAVIAFNQETGAVRSGQLDAPPGYEHWLLKFDGVSRNRDKEIADPMGFGRLEHAYSLMARAAGIEMAPTRLLEENGRAHFMTKRFDRTEDGGKLHMQSLAALAHLDIDMPDANSYEQAFDVIRRLGLPVVQAEEQFRRMAFNVVARNQDDHVKNIAFLMDKRGVWRLSPAFDVAYAYNPSGEWTSQHQMSINGQRRSFAMEDFEAVARFASLPRGRAKAIVDVVVDTVSRWSEFAAEAGVSEEGAGRVARAHRLEISAARRG